MITLIVKWLLTALAVFLVGYFLPGIHVADFPTALVVALVLGILNVTLRPVLKILAFPITILTLGLFAFIVNGFTFWLVGKFIDGFIIDTFWWAVLGALLVSIVSAMLNHLVLGSDDRMGGD